MCSKRCLASCGSSWKAASYLSPLVFLSQDTAVGMSKSPRWSHDTPSLIVCLLLKIGRQQSSYSMI